MKKITFWHPTIFGDLPPAILAIPVETCPTTFEDYKKQLLGHWGSTCSFHKNKDGEDTVGLCKYYLGVGGLYSNSSCDECWNAVTQTDEWANLMMELRTQWKKANLDKEDWAKWNRFLRSCNRDDSDVLVEKSQQPLMVRYAYVVGIAEATTSFPEFLEQLSNLA